jgi:hypothetical protein
MSCGCLARELARVKRAQWHKDHPEGAVAYAKANGTRKKFGFKEIMALRHELLKEKLEKAEVEAEDKKHAKRAALKKLFSTGVKNARVAV